MSNVNVVITDVAWSSPQRYKYNDKYKYKHKYNYKTGGNGDEADNLDFSLDKETEGSPSGNASTKQEEVLDSIVAAAGSNGAVVVWSARLSFLVDVDGSSASSMANQQPEAVLSQHSRAVNRLAWHPRRPGLLLTASQDATVKLWIRQPAAVKKEQGTTKKTQNKRSWFRFNTAPSLDDQSYSWNCRATFEAKSEAVRDVRWSPLLDDGKQYS